jgi:hypothetical protein
LPVKKLLLLLSHLGFGVAGFALGIYTLPILIAPTAPDEAELAAVAQSAAFTASFRRDLKGSDFLHWGEGEVSINSLKIAHKGRLAPGPDYRLYLTRGFVEDEAGFNALKSSAALIGHVKTFNGFVVDVPAGVNINEFDTVVVWCESFGEFITAAKYR